MIWRAYNDCLPVNWCLWKKGIDVSPICRLCFSKQETVDRALCGCKRAQLICDNMFCRIDSYIRNENNFADHIMLLAEHLTDGEFEKACIASWVIWNDRNSWCNDMKIMEWAHQCEWIHSYLTETRSASKRNICCECWCRSVECTVD